MEPQTAGGLCPQCGKLRVHRSHRRGFAERLVAAAGQGGIRRCHGCDVRFTRFAGSVVYVDEARRMLRTAAVVMAGAAAIVAALVYFL